MRIGIVNDRPIAVEALRRTLLAQSTHKVAWIAYDGADAVQRCAQDLPDLVLMDLIMPVMDGVEATRRIMGATPCPILVVTADVDLNSSRVFEALSAGALDAVNTPSMTSTGSNGTQQLLKKIDALSLFVTEIAPAQQPPLGSWASLIAIGSSAGGPAAVAAVLAAFPATLRASVVVIQHLDEQFAAGLASWLGTSSKLPVQVARHNQRLEPGRVYIAGTMDHMVLRGLDSLVYTPEPADYVYRPSVDAFFQSVVQRWKGAAVGALLTGMGRDGAKGLLAMRQAGYHTISQDQASCAVYGMPKAAAAINAASEILPLTQIGAALLSRIKSAKPLET